jgi:hypothetical protein
MSENSDIDLPGILHRPQQRPKAARELPKATGDAPTGSPRGFARAFAALLVITLSHCTIRNHSSPNLSANVGNLPPSHCYTFNKTLEL